jgi:hypothetical protein
MLPEYYFVTDAEPLPPVPSVEVKYSNFLMFNYKG